MPNYGIFVYRFHASMSFAMTVLFYMKKREIKCVQGKIWSSLYLSNGSDGLNRQGCKCAG